MGGRFAQSSLLYSALVRTDVRGLEQKMFHVKHFLLNFFAFVGGFCIVSSNSGVDNTKKMLVFCSTNMNTGISFCSVYFFGDECWKEDSSASLRSVQNMEYLIFLYDVFRQNGLVIYRVILLYNQTSYSICLREFFTADGEAIRPLIFWPICFA